MMKIETDLSNIELVSNYVLKNIEDNAIILLNGTLASGKTTLVKSLVKKIGINENVTSPTFAIQTVYDNRVYHYDIYNKSLDEFISIGLLDELERNGIHIIEWAGEKLEKILIDYGFFIIRVNINIKSKNSRIYDIEVINC